MAVSAETRERVYLSSRAVFCGETAAIRRSKKIREVVEKNKQPLTKLIKDLGIEEVITTLYYLLEKRVFESELKAKLEFPGLFLSSAVRNAERQASEDEAANSTADRLNEIAACKGEASNIKGKGADYGDLDDEESSIASSKSFSPRLVR
jgi:hypothetical protein